MDSKRFDALVQAFSASGSRRAALGALASLTSLAFEPARPGAAKPTPRATRKKKCKHGLKPCKDVAGKRQCVNLDADPANCGMCGHACATGQACQAGTCSGGCPTNRVCGDGCCPSGTVCQQDQCV